jgi:hypothetical protein
MRRFAIWALLILAACGEVKNEEPKADANVEPPVDTNDGIKSGTRLKVRWADFDGIKTFVSLFDSTRNEACSPRRFADGKTYCAPAAASVVFRDNACTMPIGMQSISCSAAQTMYYVENDPLTCQNLPKKIHARGAQITQASYYQIDRGRCMPMPVGMNQIFQLGAEVPLATLAAMEEEALSSTSARVQQRFFTSADGARVFSSHYDTELDVESFMSLDASRGGALGLPVAVNETGLYGDATCMQRRISSAVGCPVPKYLQRTVTSCPYGGTVQEILKVGIQANPSSLFSFNQSGVCQMATPAISLNYYEVGAQPMTLGTFTRSPTTEGTGRFRKIYLSDGTSKVLDPSLFDTLRQTECAPTTLVDGSIRCLPINIYTATPYFTDSACTAAIRVIEVPNSAPTGCGLPPKPKYATDVIPNTCERQALALGEPITAPLYRLLGGVCQAIALSGTTPHALNAVPLDDFAAATISND